MRRNKNIDTESSNTQNAGVDSVKQTGVKAYLKSHLLPVGIIIFLALGALGAGLKYLDEDAQRELGRRANRKSKLSDQPEQSFLNKVNPFLPAPTPTPTPQYTKEYIYAGSRLLAVEDKNANAAPPTDLGVWRPSEGNWYVIGTQGGSQPITQQWGLSADIPAPGDFDGDGKTDFALFRPSEGKWYILRSSDNGYSAPQLGMNGDKPAVADYDGDGKSDLAVFRSQDGTWTIHQSSNGQILYFNFGLQNDFPAAADYDGDGKADIAVWRNTGNERRFYVRTSAAPYYYTVPMNVNSTEPVSADYDGDGRANFAIKAGSNWVIMNSALTQTQSISWQLADDKPVQNDYDGDGKVDIAVWRNNDGTWYIRQSASVGLSNELRQVQWGLPGDVPVPAYYRR